MHEEIVSRQEIHPPPARKSRTRTFLAVGIIAFLFGAVLAALLVWQNYSWAAELFGLEEDAVIVRPQSPGADVPGVAVEQTRQAVVQVAERQGGLDERLAAMEQRLTRLDLQAQAAAGNAGRAEALLIAFAARRAIERGAPLGYLADQLRLRFADAQPNAVRTILEAAEEPVTLSQLAARLRSLAPALDQAPADEGLFDRLGRELSELFVIRKEGSPSPAVEARLDRARLFLESGRVEAAIAEVRQLPNAVAAADWIADAEEYVTAREALDLLETTAILEPRELRDTEGDPIQQPSPVAPPADPAIAPPLETTD